MKNLAILLGMMMALNLNAQNFHTTSTDTTFYGSASDSDFDAKFILFNDSTASFPMSWEVDSASVETGWDYSVCDPSVCYPIGASSGSFDLQTSSVNRIMNLHYYPNGNFGQSTVKVKLWEDAYPNLPVFLTWTGIVSNVSVNSEIASYSLMAFPNPAKGQFQIKYSFSENQTNNEIHIIDVSGRIIEKRKISNNTGVLTFDAMINGGVYFYSLVSDDQVIFNEKIIIE
ncbi:MAG: T9SS type A sorting domain-containing protein [Crocinitomicaceae bacterium]